MKVSNLHQIKKISCYKCKFKRLDRISDITLGDAWKIEKIKHKWSDDKGVSLMLTRSNKGDKLLDSIKDKLNICEVSYDILKVINPSVVVSTNKPDNREEFWDKFEKLNYME